MIESVKDESILEPLGLDRQPLGIFGLPAGMLLLPDTSECAQIASGCRAGKRPSEFPPEARYYQLALSGADPVEIANALPASGAVREFNQLVLAPTRERFEALLGRSSGDMELLVRWQGYLNGYCQLPDYKSATGAPIAAILCSSKASYLLELSDSRGAVELLREAITLVGETSPVFAAGLRADLAQILLGEPSTCGEAIKILSEALEALGNTDLNDLAAEVHLSLAIALHEQMAGDPAALREAVKHYMDATRLVSAQSSPFVFGTAHMNLALAYLAMPMAEASDQLRYGVAIASLRHAVAAFDPAMFPQAWASARLNLANALVYAPSARQGDNLVEAVEIYEEILQLRDRNEDPMGYARVSANQGNALAHLGMFDHAKAKLHDARVLFEEFGMYPEIATIREVLDHIERERVGRGSSS